MAIKKCLMKGEMTKVNKAVDKRKPATRKDQRVATKQEAMFDEIMADKKFIAGVDKLSTKSLRTTAIQNELEKRGVKTSRAKVKRMLKGEVGIPEPIIKPVPSIPIKEVQFKKATHQKIYNKYYDDFMKDPKLRTQKDFSKAFKAKLAPEIQAGFEEWKRSTYGFDPEVLKMKAARMERDVAKIRFKRFAGGPGTGLSKREILELHKMLIDMEKAVPDIEYLKMRALNQAYMNKNKMREVTLYRGNGGTSGKKMAEKIKKLKSGDTITVNQNSLVGYTPDQKIADAFGAGVDGITTRMRFKASEVVLHDDIWPKLLKKFINEKEFMCLGRKRKIALTDVSIKPGSFR